MCVALNVSAFFRERNKTFQRGKTEIIVTRIKLQNFYYAKKFSMNHLSKLATLGLHTLCMKYVIDLRSNMQHNNEMTFAFRCVAIEEKYHV